MFHAYCLGITSEQCGGVSSLDLNVDYSESKSVTLDSLTTSSESACYWSLSNSDPDIYKSGGKIKI